MPKIQNSRKQGIEVRALNASAMFLARHPRTLGTSATLGTSMYALGPTTTGIALASTAAAGCLVYRTAPRTWDRTFGPAVSAWWRRWSFYERLWSKSMNGCDLSRMDRNTAEIKTPKLRKVRVRGSWDVLYVRMLPGHKPAHYEEAAEALAACWKTERVAVQKVSPNTVALLVERCDPFALGSAPVPASEIPSSSDLVDLGKVDVGAFESGTPFELSLFGSHLLVAGVTRSGKSGGIWNMLRSLGPMIQDRQVIIHAADLKGGAELDPGLPLFTSYARTAEGCLRMIKKVLARMEDRQVQLRQDGRRKFSLSFEEPFEIILIDELLVMTSLADPQVRKQFEKALGTILTQGAGLGFFVSAFVQDPTTDGVPMRKHFPTKMALRLDQDNHVDMILGEGQRLRGALADQIPESQQGVGYVAVEGVREPRRFRYGLVDDSEIAELVATSTPAGLVPEICDPATDTSAAAA